MINCRWGEKSTRRLKTTIQDLEESLESERRKNNNLVKNQRKVERDSNTLEIKIQHGRKNSEKIQVGAMFAMFFLIVNQG